jgi:hypothetical protein
MTCRPTGEETKDSGGQCDELEIVFIVVSRYLSRGRLAYHPLIHPSGGKSPSVSACQDPRKLTTSEAHDIDSLAMRDYE